jgi:predicted O-methyltransferase YrrM
MTFTEDWFSAASCAALQNVAVSVAHLDGAVIEVGSWEGKSTIALAQACYPHAVYAVDTWNGSPGEPSQDLADGRDVYAHFLANIAAETQGNVIWHRTDWRDFFAEWDWPIRMLFIDAEHTYTEVRENIGAALPHIVPGGVICGDDQHHPPVREAVTDTLGVFEVDASLWIWRNDG